MSAGGWHGGGILWQSGVEGMESGVLSGGLRRILWDVLSGRPDLAAFAGEPGNGADAVCIGVSLWVDGESGESDYSGFSGTDRDCCPASSADL